MSIETAFRTVTISLPADIDRSAIETAIVQTARLNGLRCTRGGKDSDAFHLTPIPIERPGIVTRLLQHMRGSRK